MNHLRRAIKSLQAAGEEDKKLPALDPSRVVYCYSCETFSEYHGEPFCEPCGSDHVSLVKRPTDYEVVDFS